MHAKRPTNQPTNQHTNRRRLIVTLPITPNDQPTNRPTYQQKTHSYPSNNSHYWPSQMQGGDEISGKQSCYF